MPSTPLRIDEHVARAERHAEVGHALRSAANDEWAAVPFFYAGYHLMRAALLEDPIFDEVALLVAKSPKLTMEDRLAEHHRARRNSGQGLGVNDLVLLLYRPYAGSYERLHQASISVRYGAGLPDGALDALPACLEEIENAYGSDLLRA